MNDSLAKKLLQKTEDDYNRIASLFSNKRGLLTPDVIELGNHIKKWDVVLDFGCGNGRFFEVVEKKGGTYLGVDFSQNLINIAKVKYPKGKFIKINEFKMSSYKKNSFDIVFLLAVLHHVPSEKYRKELLAKLCDILKPGGRIVLTVWDLRSNNLAKKLIYKQAILKLFGLTKMDYGDIFYPFKNQNGEVAADRYLHAFTKKELKWLVEDKFNIQEINTNFRGNRVVNKNIVLVAKKI